MSIEDDTKRYRAALHGMQSGVKTAIEKGLSDETTPKHLRVGVNAAMSEHAALASLLMDKGIITAEEYAAAVADFMEKEKALYEERLSEALGFKVTLA